MLIYIIEFILILLLTTRISNKNSKKNKFILLLIILICSLVGGLRDFSIGTDVSVYAKHWFEIARSSSSFKTYCESINNTEYGYLLLNYITSRFTGDVTFFLFVLQLFCNTLVFLTLYRYREKCPLWMSSFIYLCTFYCLSFNIMRQACALSIILYGLKYLGENKIFKLAICAFIASMFHSTALVAGVLIILFYLISKTKSKIQIFIIILLIIFCGLGIFFIKDFIELGYKLGIVNYRIYSYINEFSKENLSISGVELVIKLFIFILCLLQAKKIKTNLDINKFLFISMVIEFILFQSKIVISYSDRFSFYFGYLNMIFIPQIFRSLSTKRKEKFIFSMLFIVIFFSFWIYKFVVCGHCEIYPYKSPILGI